MNGFKYKYTRYINSDERCTCRDVVPQDPTRHTVESESVDERESSRAIYEASKEVVYYTYKPRSDKDDFRDCIDLGFHWQTSSQPCKNCWLTLKKWKTIPTFESEHFDLDAKDFKLGAIVNYTKFNYHFHCERLYICNFNHDRKEIQIGFDKEKKNQMIISYLGLHRIFLMEKGENIHMYFHLKNAPLLFKDIGQVRSQVTSFSEDHNLSREVVGLSNMASITLNKKKANFLLNRLRARCPTVIDFVFCTMTEANPTLAETYQPRKELIMNLEWESFKTTYAWNVLLNGGYAVIDQITCESRNFERNITRIKNLGETIRDIFVEACFGLFKIMEVGNIVPFFDGLTFYCRQRAEYRTEIRNPEGIVTVGKIVMTPTRRIFLPPQQHITNRVLRNYDENFVLQIGIKQDNMDMVTFHLNGNPDANFMEDNFKLRNGIKIGLCHFEFLGCSNSQMREHGLWMYARDSNNTSAEDIRQEIGFNNIDGDVSKKLSRLGLFFSSSVNSKDLPDMCVIPENDFDDIKRNDYTFSDGIGKISPELMEVLLGHRSEDRYMPSAIQVRYPGYKGMLAVSPDLKGLTIHFRKSMHKFESNSTERVIDILKTSGPRRVYLNRSLSMVLEQKGVPTERMLEFQENMIRQLVEKLLTDNDSEFLLKSSCQFLRIPYRRLQNAGFDLAVDPFLRTLITTGCQRRLSLLREKANIAVPDNQGRIMFGVLDELGVLAPHEVYVRITLDVESKNNSETETLTGPILVTRNPCHHPGDIQRLTAVNRKELSHHLDTIVFPQTGDRPLPDMMGGGDLDGDEFVVIWSKDLLFEENDPPMDYRFEGQRRENQDSTVNELIDFFYRYLKFNDLGRVCNAHLVYGDTERDGIRSDKCMEIAQIIPQALDYNKTGNLPTFEERIEKYPDFMEKFYLNPTYRSESVLGKLYRKALRYFPYGGIAVKKLDVEVNPLLEYEGWEELTENALEDLRTYEEKLRAILSQQGLSCFEETILGHVNKNSYASSKGDQESLITILEKSISRLIEDTKNNFDDRIHKICMERNITDSNEQRELRLKLASACYVITYSRDALADLSFPWALGNYICDVAEANSNKSKGKKKKSKKSSVIKKLAEILESKHGVNWTDPLLFIRKWALQNKLCEETEENNLFLALIYSQFSINLPRCVDIYDSVKQVIEFFEWASSDSMDYSPQTEEERELLEKLVILASLCYVGLPLSMNTEYLGFPDPEKDLESGPLDLKDFEGLRIAERKTAIDQRNFEIFLRAKSGVEIISLNNKSQYNHHIDLVFKARGLTWQLIYLTKLIFDHYRRYCSPIN